MTTTISLNRQALHDLIDKDPQFEFELKSAVLSEIGRRFFDKDAKKVIEAAGPELFKKAVESLQKEEDLSYLIQKALKDSITERSPYNYAPKISTEMQTMISKEVERQKMVVVGNAADTIARTFNDTVLKAVNERCNAPDIDDRVQKRVDRLVDEEINRRVDAKVKERLALMQQALAA